MEPYSHQRSWYWESVLSVRVVASVFRSGGMFVKTFDDKKKAREVKRPKGPASSEGFSWGFCAVVCCTMGLAAFLMFSAWGRFSGVAWGSLVENRNDLSVENEGFVSVDMSDAYEE